MRHSRSPLLLAIVLAVPLAVFVPNVLVDIAHANEISDFANKIADYVEAAVAAVAIMTIIIAGFRLVAAQGDSGQMETAKKAIIYAVIGLIIVAAAELIQSAADSLAP